MLIGTMQERSSKGQKDMRECWEDAVVANGSYMDKGEAQIPHQRFLTVLVPIIVGCGVLQLDARGTRHHHVYGGIRQSQTRRDILVSAPTLRMRYALHSLSIRRQVRGCEKTGRHDASEDEKRIPIALVRRYACWPAKRLALTQMPRLYYSSNASDEAVVLLPCLDSPCRIIMTSRPRTSVCD